MNKLTKIELFNLNETCEACNGSGAEVLSLNDDDTMEGEVMCSVCGGTGEV